MTFQESLTATTPITAARLLRVGQKWTVVAVTAAGVEMRADKEGAMSTAEKALKAVTAAGAIPVMGWSPAVRREAV